MIYKIELINYVAPCMGAWIETKRGLKNLIGGNMSHPVWVRGLKLRRPV